jgi:hypothetical protein
MEIFQPQYLARAVRSSGVQEFRSSGVQEFRSSGVQEFRSSGVQEFRSSGRPAVREITSKVNALIFRIFRLFGVHNKPGKPERLSYFLELFSLSPADSPILHRLNPGKS